VERLVGNLAKHGHANLAAFTIILGAVGLTDAASGKKADVHFAAGQAIAPWPGSLPAATGTRIDVSGLGAPATLTLKVLSPVPSGLEGMAQSLIRANCQAQIDVLIDTFSARSEG